MSRPQTRRASSSRRSASHAYTTQRLGTRSPQHSIVHKPSAARHYIWMRSPKSPRCIRLSLCRLAVRLAHGRCPPALPACLGGDPRRYNEGSLLLVVLLRTLWRLSSQDRHEWLVTWLALALACGLSSYDRQGRLRIPSSSQRCKRRHVMRNTEHLWKRS